MAVAGRVGGEPVGRFARGPDRDRAAFGGVQGDVRGVGGVEEAAGILRSVLVPGDDDVGVRRGEGHLTALRVDRTAFLRGGVVLEVRVGEGGFHAFQVDGAALTGRGVAGEVGALHAHAERVGVAFALRVDRGQGRSADGGRFGVLDRVGDEARDGAAFEDERVDGQRAGTARSLFLNVGGLDALDLGVLAVVAAFHRDGEGVPGIEVGAGAFKIGFLTAFHGGIKFGGVGGDQDAGRGRRKGAGRDDGRHGGREDGFRAEAGHGGGDGVVLHFSLAPNRVGSPSTVFLRRSAHAGGEEISRFRRAAHPSG